MIVRLNKSKSPAVKSHSILKWIIGKMTLELKLNGRTQDRWLLKKKKNMCYCVLRWKVSPESYSIVSDKNKNTTKEGNHYVFA